ncbi:MAG: 50S ribosomal protein L17 [Candidatus Omnitrophota bacterium]|jgi:large subunit ribosomal protein L17|nr:MAG: 50S ribosomal protein L17 [Candidatus Omnitrophota bacterium]
MRHRKKRFQLSRFTSWRKATIIALAKNLLRHQRIRTTVTRAHAARPLAERLITLAKADTLAARRRAFAILVDHALVGRLFREIGPLFKNRAGGYTRIVRLGLRRGDNASLAIFELTEHTQKPKKAKKQKESKLEQPAADSTQKVESKTQALHEEKKPHTSAEVKERPPVKKIPKKFLGGIKNIFKKERDSL